MSLPPIFPSGRSVRFGVQPGSARVAFRGDYTGASRPARACNAARSMRDTVTEAKTEPGMEETS